MGFPKRWLLIVAVLMLSATGGCKQGPWPLWSSYAAHFIDAQGRVIDHSAGDHTTSEGQAYAMFFALADDDRPAFDRVLNWTQVNLAGNDLQTHLPAWLWGRDKTGNWTTLDPNPASDADVWMAYTLVEAGRLWKAPKYTAIGRGMMAQIAKREVADLPGFGPMLLPGSTGFQHEHSYTLNPSYLPVFLFDRFGNLDPSGPWNQISEAIPHLLEQSARHGFAMDWVNYIPQDGFYPSNAQPSGSVNPNPPVGSYDAIRVYLWAGMMDGKNPARGQILSSLPGMSVYLANHDAPPEKVSDQGVPEAQDGPVGFSAAVLPYLRAYPDMSRLSAQQTVRMSKMRDSASGLYGKDLAYYDQNLALFCNGFLDGRFRFGPGGQLQVEWNRS